MTVDNSTPGTHDVEVIYSGDENTEGTSTSSKVTVPKYDTPMYVTVENIKAGDNAIITVNVPDGASGNVTIEIDGVQYTGEIKDGKATINTLEKLRMAKLQSLLKTYPLETNQYM